MPIVRKDGTSPDFLKVLLLIIAGLLSRLRGLFHFDTQAQRTHISPDLANVFQTLSFCSRFACISPSERQFTMGRPDRILFFMIHNRFVNCLVFAVVHFSLLLTHSISTDVSSSIFTNHPLTRRLSESCMRWLKAGCRHF